jgi:hypothetical protein
MAMCNSSPSRRNVAMCDLRNSAKLVHCWPVGSTNCRSSSQIEQRAAGSSDGSYCVPQVGQIQACFTAHLLPRNQARDKGRRIPARPKDSSKRAL